MSALCSLPLPLPVLVLVFLVLCSPVSTIHLSPGSPRGLLYEDKSRLGSVPPSCHNKCNQCHPCMAVQVPTLPAGTGHNPMPMAFHDGHHPHDPSSSSSSSSSSSPSPSSSITSGSKYSNYKPLGWKCRCNDHFYNP